MYTSVTDFAETRKKAVADGLESSELAALLIEKFAEGASSEGNKEAIKLADRYCQEIDQNYMENRQLRYRTIAKLDLTEAIKS